MCVRTWEDFGVRVLVAVVWGAAERVNAAVMFDGRGADEGPVSWDQFIFVYALALVDGLTATWPADGDKADAIRRAAGVGTAAVTVTLEGWRKKRQDEEEEGS